jgi:hypothetical protein
MKWGGFVSGRSDQLMEYEITTSDLRQKWRNDNYIIDMKERLLQVR